MQLVKPFARTPSTPEPIIAQVRRQLADDDWIDDRVPTGVLDRVADQAVRELWSSRVKTFVPVLALRTARELLRDQDVLFAAELPGMRDGNEVLKIMPLQAARVPRDLLHIDEDVLPLDDRDVLPF